MENISETSRSHDYTSCILNSLLLMHRNLFDVLFLAECRPSYVSDVMRARLYILDNCLVHTYRDIDADFMRACPPVSDLCQKFQPIKIFNWTPADVRSIA